jgi:hypothetical protein
MDMTSWHISMAYQYDDADISRQPDADMSWPIIWRCADICHDLSSGDVLTYAMIYLGVIMIAYVGAVVDISSGDMACLSKMSHDICGGDMVWRICGHMR